MLASINPISVQWLLHLVAIFPVCIHHSSPVATVSVLSIFLMVATIVVLRTATFRLRLFLASTTATLCRSLGAGALNRVYRVWTNLLPIYSSIALFPLLLFRLLRLRRHRFFSRFLRDVDGYVDFVPVDEPDAAADQGQAHR